MEFPREQKDPDNLVIAWAEDDLRVLSLVYTEKLNLQVEDAETPDSDQLSDTDIEFELNQFLDFDLEAANAYANRKHHLSKPDEIPRELLPGMVVDLRDFAKRTIERGKDDLRRSGIPRYANYAPVERIDLAKKALAMARQLADPEAAVGSEVVRQEFEAKYEMPARGESGVQLELPATSAEIGEAEAA